MDEGLTLKRVFSALYGGGGRKAAAFAISGVDFCPLKPYIQFNCWHRLDADHGSYVTVGRGLANGSRVIHKRSSRQKTAGRKLLDGSRVSKDRRKEATVHPTPFGVYHASY